MFMGLRRLGLTRRSRVVSLSRRADCVPGSRGEGRHSVYDALMGRGWLSVCVVGGCLAWAPAALATTQSGHAGDVSATFTFQGKFPNFSHERLSIVRAGKTAYSAPVSSHFCGSSCAPLATGRASSVDVVDLEPGGEPNVLLRLYSGGAHCCAIDQVFSYDSSTGHYVETEHNFGDPGERLVDLHHTGQHEFLTADDSFAYEFTDFAASGLPIQILTFSGGRFHDVTASYPKLIAGDAQRWLKAFTGQRKSHYQDTTGVIAAWAADEDRLGHQRQVARFLSQQAKAGHLNTPLTPEVPTGQKFIARLQKFLGKHGYLRR